MNTALQFTVLLPVVVEVDVKNLYSP